jgi:hypothetical protein
MSQHLLGAGLQRSVAPRNLVVKYKAAQHEKRLDVLFSVEANDETKGDGIKEIKLDGG